MIDRADTARKLLALVMHEGTPEGERSAAAVQCCRLVEQLGLLRGGAARSVAAPVVEVAVDRESGDGTVLVGASKYCRECVQRLEPRRGPRGARLKPKDKLIRKWERAIKHSDGSYSHVECARAP